MAVSLSEKCVIKGGGAKRVLRITVNSVTEKATIIGDFGRKVCRMEREL